MKTVVFALAMVACASAAVFSAIPRPGEEGRYYHDNSGSYNSEDGRYHPDNSGSYVPDGSGSYVHDDAGYRHQDDKYRHQADRFGGNGGNGGGSGGNGGSGGFGPGSRYNAGLASGNRFAGNSGLGSGNRLGAGSGSRLVAGSGIAPASGFGAPVALKQGSAAGFYDNRNYGIIRKIENNQGNAYNYLYETENGILAEEQGKLEREGSKDEAINAAGYFTYTGPDNVIYRVDYTANEEGFVPVADHIPTPPPIPAQIIRSLEYQRAAGQL